MLGAPDENGDPLTATTLLKQMEIYHISRAVVSHSFALLDPLMGNQIAKEASAASEGKLGVCAVLDPILNEACLPGSGDLFTRLEAFAPEAIRICPENARTVFHPFYWEEILEAANARGLPLIVDYDYPPDFFITLPEAAGSYPNIKFILVRYGLCRSRHVMPLLKRCRNVYFTVESMLDYLQLEEITQACGCERLLFGSSYPQRNPAGALGLVLFAQIPRKCKAQILDFNWEAIRA